jgi:hypothetical protein
VRLCFAGDEVGHKGVQVTDQSNPCKHLELGSMYSKRSDESAVATWRFHARGTSALMSPASTMATAVGFHGVALVM